jgi:hypothetical protein
VQLEPQFLFCPILDTTVQQRQLMQKHSEFIRQQIVDGYPEQFVQAATVNSCAHHYMYQLFVQEEIQAAAILR